ncbi:hypothetical protein BLOT_000809 [Blomia tropicalis]|nr:hypothetical protein BLOT_000809 [Blomia tropicalis]
MIREYTPSLPPLPPPRSRQRQRKLGKFQHKEMNQTNTFHINSTFIKILLYLWKPFYVQCR